MISASEAVLAAARAGMRAETAEEGFAEVRALSGTNLSDAALAEAVAAGIRDGLLRDPVRLLPGRLQCCWNLS